MCVYPQVIACENKVYLAHEQPSHSHLVTPRHHGGAGTRDCRDIPLAIPTGTHSPRVKSRVQCPGVAAVRGFACRDENAVS